MDWAQYNLDEPLQYIETNAIRSALSGLAGIDANRQWTLREVADYIGVGGLHPTLVGSPQTIADALESIIDETGIDGFNLAYAVSPGTFEDFIELVIPELKRRGRIKSRNAQPVTLRECLQGNGQKRLRDDHPATMARDRSLWLDVR